MNIPSKPPVALDNDEYGNACTGQAATRYGWLGGKQRSTETLTGLSLMGVRLYNPVSGRFLSADPIYGGNANAYDYVHTDPLNQFELDGRICMSAGAASLAHVPGTARRAGTTRGTITGGPPRGS